MKGPTVNAELAGEAEILGSVMARLSDFTHRRLVWDLELFQLTLPQYAALVVLDRQRDGSTMTDLAAEIYQISATITGIVDRLEQHGYVERQRDPADRRVWRVYLTPSGRVLLREVEQHRKAGWLRVWSQFEPEDRRTMLRLMERYLEITQPGGSRSG